MLTATAAGFIARNAETRQIGDKSYACVTIAHSEGKGDNKKTTWVQVMCSDKLASYLTKGKCITVIGTLTVNAYTNKEGKAVPSITIWSNQLEFCGESHSATSQVNGEQVAAMNAQAQQTALYGQPRDVRNQPTQAPTADDLPF